MSVVQSVTYAANAYRIEHAGSYVPSSAAADFSFLLSAKDSASAAAKRLSSIHARQGDAQHSYDFTHMTRGQIADVGNALFQQGKISLVELFRFEHPDGVLRVQGQLPADVSRDDRLDFIALTQKAIRDMEQTGESKRSDSGYKMLQGLLIKLRAWQQ